MGITNILKFDMQRLYYIDSTKKLEELNKRLMMGLETITMISGADNRVVVCKVSTLTEKEIAEVHRIKIVGEHVLRDVRGSYRVVAELPDQLKSMLGGEYDARMVHPNYFEIVESGLTINKCYCELVEPKINLEELHK